MKYPSDWIVNDTDFAHKDISFKSPDGAGIVLVGIWDTNQTMDQLTVKQRQLATAPDAKGTVLEFNTNTYFLSGHPALRELGIGNGFSNVTTKVMDLQSIFWRKTV